MREGVNTYANLNSLFKACEAVASGFEWVVQNSTASVETVFNDTN